MWINRSQLNDIQSRLYDLECENHNLKTDVTTLKTRIKILESCHCQNGISMHSDECIHTYVSYTHYKEVETINTDLIPNVTFDELAKYVLDGKPIERNETVKVKYYKGGK